MYRRGPGAGFVEKRIVPILKTTGRYGLYLLAIMYPLYLVIIGVAFGGLVFWTFLATSTAVLGFALKRLGYSANFRNWDIGGRTMIGVVLAFPIALGFYEGLIYLRIWLIPIFVVALGGGLAYLIRRVKS